MKPRGKRRYGSFAAVHLELTGFLAPSINIQAPSMRRARIISNLNTGSIPGRNQYDGPSLGECGDQRGETSSPATARTVILNADAFSLYAPSLYFGPHQVQSIVSATQEVHKQARPAEAPRSTSRNSLSHHHHQTSRDSTRHYFSLAASEAL